MFENVDGRTDDGRTDGRTDDGVTGILIAHLEAFGSGELIKQKLHNLSHGFKQRLIIQSNFLTAYVGFSKRNWGSVALSTETYEFSFGWGFKLIPLLKISDVPLNNYIF